MRRLRFTLLLLAVGAMFAVAVPSAVSEPGAQVIRLVWVQTSSHPSGQKRSWTSTLLNATAQFGRPAGTKVGAEVGFSQGAQFVGGIKLPGGVVTYSGKAKHLGRDGIVVTVVDGSGAFTGATGTYTRSVDPTHGRRTIVVLRLQYGSPAEQGSSSHGAGHHHS